VKVNALESHAAWFSFFVSGVGAPLSTTAKLSWAAWSGTGPGVRLRRQAGAATAAQPTRLSLFKDPWPFVAWPASPMTVASV
jgi:hypothetical protein